MPVTESEQMHAVFEHAFNAGDLEALMGLYEPDAALIPQPGAIAEGTAAIRDSLRWFLDRGGQSTLDTKLVLRVGDLAFLSNRWSLTGATMPDGSPAELAPYPFRDAEPKAQAGDEPFSHQVERDDRIEAGRRDIERVAGDEDLMRVLQVRIS